MTQNGRNATTDTLARNRAAMDRFLAKLRSSGNIRLSCQAAGVDRTTVYRWRNKWITFANEWDEAKEDACDILEGEAWKRAIKNQSDRLLMFLLKAHRRAVYGDKVDHSVLLKSLDLSALSVSQLERISAGEDVLSVLATPGKSGA